MHSSIRVGITRSLLRSVSPLSARIVSLPAHWWRRILFAALLLVAFAVRLYGIGWGLPYVDHPDEPQVADAALGMVRRGDWDPRFFDYPSLYLYALRLVFDAHWRYGLATGVYTRIEQLPLTTKLYLTSPGFFLCGRALTATLGTATVGVLYTIGRRNWSVRVGLAAAAVLAALPFHVRHSQFITVDVPATLMTLLALDAALRLIERGDLWSYALAGLAAGIAASTKYNAGAVVLTIAAAHMIRWGRAGLHQAWWLLWAGVWMLFGFVMITPYALLTPQNFMRGIYVQYVDYATATRGDLLGRWPIGGYLGFFWATGLEPLPALAVALGTLVVVARRDRAGLALLAFVLPYLLFFLAWPQHLFRNLLPIFPALAIFAGVGIDAMTVFLADLIERIGDGGWSLLAARAPALLNSLSAFALVTGIAIGPLIDAIGIDRAKMPPSRSELMANYIRNEVPRGELIAVELSPALWVGDPVVVPVSFVTQHYAAWYLAHGFRYLVANGWYRNTDDRSVYERLRAGAKLVHTFTIGGDPIDVLDLGEHPDAIPMQARAARFGDSIALLGYQLGVGQEQRLAISSLDGAKPLRAGQWLLLDLYLQAQQQLRYNCMLSLELEDAHGKTVAWRKAVIRGRDYPSTRWRPGEMIDEIADMQLPSRLPPGVYHLHMGIGAPGRPPQALAAPAARSRASTPLVLADVKIVP